VVTLSLLKTSWLLPFKRALQRNLFYSILKTEKIQHW
jgi:hypothetical protein